MKLKFFRNIFDDIKCYHESFLILDFDVLSSVYLILLDNVICLFLHLSNGTVNLGVLAFLLSAWKIVLISPSFYQQDFLKLSSEH